MLFHLTFIEQFDVGLRLVRTIEINYSRLMMPLALSRGILLRPRSERVETELSLFVSMEACRFVYILANRRP